MNEYHVGAARCKVCSNKRITESRHKKREAYLAEHPKPIRTTKLCKPCGRDLLFEAFYLRTDGTLSAYCKECQKRIANVSRIGKDRQRDKCTRWRTSVAWFYAQREAQGNLCAICRTAETQPVKKGGPVRSLAIDHDHVSGTVRGLLCFRCNTALHQLEKHGLGWADAAVAYLKQYKETEHAISAQAVS